MPSLRLHDFQQQLIQIRLIRRRFRRFQRGTDGLESGDRARYSPSHVAVGEQGLLEFHVAEKVEGDQVGNIGSRKGAGEELAELTSDNRGQQGAAVEDGYEAVAELQQL